MASESSPPVKKFKTNGNENGDNGAFELHCINTIRALSADQPSAAKSGHPGAPMGCAPMAHLLWGEVMNYSPSKPEWWNRDRFVLSNGHGCALQYSMLHMTGYGLTIDDLKNFRQLGSLTPGHPENFVTDGEIYVRFLLFVCGYMYMFCWKNGMFTSCSYFYLLELSLNL